MAKWPVRKQTLRTARNTQKNVPDIQNKLIFGVFWISPFLLYLIFIKMFSPRNVRLPPWYGKRLSLGV